MQAVSQLRGNDPTFPSIWEELIWRGLVDISTDPEALREVLSGPPVVVYCGFDPTAPSLHLGNLVQLLVLRRLQLAGHKPLGLVGGATGLIGDPRPTSERTLNSRELVADWVQSIRSQVERFLSFEGDNAARVVNNLDWTAPLSAIDFLREIGKHFRVGSMLKKEAVSARLNSDEGISFTEFSYQLIQASDFLHLFRDYGCILQTGGSDQWGNLTSGVSLIRRVEGAAVHALGTPLIVNSDGSKFGKSEGNAIWLDPELVSPYSFYQYWINTGDPDVVDRLKVFTFLSRSEIEEYGALADSEPHKRAGQLRLAMEVCTLVHGVEAARASAAASAAVFGDGDLHALDPVVLGSVVATLPNAKFSLGTTVTESLVATGLSTSQSDARRAIAQGGVTLDGKRVREDNETVSGSLPGGFSIVKRGKRAVAGLVPADEQDDAI